LQARDRRQSWLPLAEAKQAQAADTKHERSASGTVADVRRAAPFLVVGVLAVSGCGSSKSTIRQTTVAPTTSEPGLATVSSVEGCLERAGFKVSHNGATPRELNRQRGNGWQSVWSDVALGEGSDRSTAFLAARGSAGQGEATVQVYSNAGSAEHAAGQAVKASKRAGRIFSTATPESEGVEVGSKGNVVWAAWGSPNAGITSEQVASCA
jgi:hypothetical protein